MIVAKTGRGFNQKQSSTPPPAPPQNGEHGHAMSTADVNFWATFLFDFVNADDVKAMRETNSQKENHK